MKLGKSAYAWVEYSYGWDNIRVRTKEEIIDWWRRIHSSGKTMKARLITLKGKSENKYYRLYS